MTTKKIEAHIIEAFKKLGFEEKEIVEGCWLLERKGGASSWIVYHKFLERVALKANIIFSLPVITNCTNDEVSIVVNGKMGEFEAWSFGEASPKNLTSVSSAYRWSMAEKRAKDRVILKLLGVAGDMYSEEEADEFKKHDKVENKVELITEEQLAEFDALKINKEVVIGLVGVKDIKELTKVKAAEYIEKKKEQKARAELKAVFPDAEIKIVKE